MKRKTFVISIASALLIFATGCTTIFAKKNIESRSKAILFTITTLVLQNNSGNVQVRNGFVQASSDLKFLAAQDPLDVLTVLAIVQSLPQVHGTAQVVIAGVTMLFSDELSSFSVTNPVEVKLAAKGCYEGIDAALGLIVPKAKSNPAMKYQKEVRSLKSQ
jgi:hypothetical protein